MKPIQENDLEPTGEFAAALRDLRAAVTHIADRETARPVALSWLAPARQRRRSHHQRMILGWACAAMLCFATLPFAIPSRPAATQAQIQPTASAPVLQAAEPTTGLLEQVDADVSESVPSSLAPLAELGNMDTVSANTSGGSLFDGSALAQPEGPNAAH
jgi:hypothetical protein